MVTIERAIEILTPDLTHYTPSEYEEALSMARKALKCFLLLDITPQHDMKPFTDGEQKSYQEMLKKNSVSTGINLNDIMCGKYVFNLEGNKSGD